MINGTVEAGRIPVIRLKFRGVGGPDADLIVAVDTYFSEQISLPQMWIQALALPHVGEDTVTLADGSDLTVNYYSGIVSWDGQDRPVTIFNMEGNPLVGMGLMDNYTLVLDAKVGGTLTLTYNP